MNTVTQVQQRATDRPTWGARVQQERTSRGWSQTELAERAGTSKSAVSRLEHGARRVPDGVRVRIAAAFGLLPHEVFPYEDAPASAPVSTQRRSA